MSLAIDLAGVGRLEELAFRGWPALESRDVAGWRLRFAGGYTKRANSINALTPDAETDRATIQGLETAYRTRGQTPIWRLSPLAPPALFDAVIDAVRGGADAAVPGLPISDTVKRVDGDHVVETIARDALVAVQTPQAFRTDVLRAAHTASGEATDDAALVEAAGGRVVVVSGDPRNLKITTPADLVVAAALLVAASEEQR